MDADVESAWGICGEVSSGPRLRADLCAGRESPETREEPLRVVKVERKGGEGGNDSCLQSSGWRDEQSSELKIRPN